MTPRIYVASLSDYNAGGLHGVWIDAAQDVEVIQAEIDAMLARSREPVAEDWAVHDYEDLPSSLGEYPDLAQVSAIAQGIDEHGEAFEAYVDTFDADVVSVEEFSERYIGEFATQADFAEELMESTGGLGEIHGHLRCYFDFDAYGRDCLLSGDVCRSGDYWFWNY